MQEGVMTILSRKRCGMMRSCANNGLVHRSGKGAHRNLKITKLATGAKAGLQCKLKKCLLGLFCGCSGIIFFCCEADMHTQNQLDGGPLAGRVMIPEVNFLYQKELPTWRGSTLFDIHLLFPFSCKYKSPVVEF